MVERKHRRSSFVQAPSSGWETVVTDLAALGIGFAILLAISSPPPPANKSGHCSVTHSRDVYRLNRGPNDLLAYSPAMRVGIEPQVRPTVLYSGCASRDLSMTTVTWSSWGSTGGSGSDTLHVNNCQPDCATGSVNSSPAFVVVSNPVAGVSGQTDHSPSGVVMPQSSSQPGSGWGSGSTCAAPPSAFDGERGPGYLDLHTTTTIGHLTRARIHHIAVPGG